MPKLPQLPKRPPKEDPYENVAANVLDIVNHEVGGALGPAVKDRLMQALIIYIEGYGSTIHRHAFRLGRDSKDPKYEPEEEN